MSKKLVMVKEFYRCNKNLTNNNDRVFTKGKVYQRVKSGGLMQLLNDHGRAHGITNTAIGWGKHFKLIEK